MVRNSEQVEGVAGRAVGGFVTSDGDISPSANQRSCSMNADIEELAQ